MAANAGGIRAGRAFVEMFLKAKPLDVGLDAVAKRLKAFSETAAKYGAIAIGGGLGLLAPVLGTLTKAIERTESIGDVADVFGLTADSASRLASAFEIAGGSIDELEKSLAKLTKVNTTGRPLDEFLLDVADALGEIDDPTQRFAAAADLFGDKFARNFIDTGGDVKGLLGNAPAVTRQQIDQAKAVRMEWTRTGIVLQNATLPILTSLGPAIATVSGFLQENAHYIPSIAALGAGLVGAGMALTGLSVVASGAAAALTSIAALASPMGLLTAGIVAGVAAWAKYTDAGQTAAKEVGWALSQFGQTWEDVKAALASGDLETAMKIAGLGMERAWNRSLDALKDGLKKTLAGAQKDLAAWMVTPTINGTKLEDHWAFKVWNPILARSMKTTAKDREALAKDIRSEPTDVVSPDEAARRSARDIDSANAITKLKDEAAARAAKAAAEKVAKDQADAAKKAATAAQAAAVPAMAAAPMKAVNWLNSQSSAAWGSFTGSSGSLQNPAKAFQDEQLKLETEGNKLLADINAKLGGMKPWTL